MLKSLRKEIKKFDAEFFFGERFAFQNRYAKIIYDGKNRQKLKKSTYKAVIE